MPRRQISPQRKGAYYAGTALQVIGFLTFGSVFVTGIMHFGDFDNFESETKSAGLRAILGMAVIILGSVIRGIGVRGVAGSGMILDPQSAREDVEPWSRMAGGMLKDALDEGGINPGASADAAPREPDFAQKLRNLHALYQDGILTEEEYRKEKAEHLERN